MHIRRAEAVNWVVRIPDSVLTGLGKGRESWAAEFWVSHTPGLISVLFWVLSFEPTIFVFPLFPSILALCLPYTCMPNYLLSTGSISIHACATIYTGHVISLTHDMIHTMPQNIAISLLSNCNKWIIFHSLYSISKPWEFTAPNTQDYIRISLERSSVSICVSVLSEASQGLVSFPGTWESMMEEPRSQATWT